MLQNLTELFKLLEKEFPYSTMSATFKGHHHIIYKDGKLIINIWYKSRLFPFTFTDDNFDGEEDDFQEIVDLIKPQILNWKPK